MATQFYGGWRRKRLGLFGFTGVQTIYLIATITFIAFSTLISRKLLLFGIPFLLVLLGSMIRIKGVSVFDHVLLETRLRVALMKGYGRYSRVSRTGGNDCELPGSLASTAAWRVDETAITDSYGLIVNEKSETVTATWIVNSIGHYLNDEDMVNAYVSRWGNFMGSLCSNPVIDHLNVTVSTQINESCLSATYVEDTIDLTAPKYGVDLLNDLTKLETAGSPLVETRVSICFDTVKGENKTKPLTERVDEIDGLVRRISTQLIGCGVSAVKLATVEELAAMLKTAFAPNEKLETQKALQKNETDGLAWSQCGPVNASEQNRNHFVHNGRYTQACFWDGAPRMEVTASILTDLCSPSKYAKTVSIIYKPTPTERAYKQLQLEKTASETRRQLKMGSNFDVSARERKDAEFAEMAAEAEAAGAGLVDMTVIATTTVDDKDDLTAALSHLKGSAQASKIRMRSATGSHAALMIATLPAGIRPTDLAGKKNEVTLWQNNDNKKQKTEKK